MKSNIYLTSLLALTLLISSCGSLSVTRKRYSRGLNIDLFNAKDEKKSDVKAKVATKKVPATQEMNSETVAETTMADVTPPENTEMAAIRTEQLKQDNAVYSSHPGSVSKFKTLKSVKKQFGELSKTKKHHKDTQLSKSDKSEVDVETILLIICCFIPIASLIAIYIHDGSITANFWIDLLLYLTVVLWVVYALLVILDIIDFA